MKKSLNMVSKSKNKYDGENICISSYPQAFPLPLMEDRFTGSLYFSGSDTVHHTWTLIFIIYLLSLCSNISAVK